MKYLLVILSSLLIVSSAFAELITVDVPAGYNAVLISSTVYHSGCENETYFLSVVKTDDKYIAGNDLGVKHNNPITKNLMPTDIDPISACSAVVATTYALRVEHMDKEPETIQIEIPESISSLATEFKVEIQDIEIVR